MRKEDDCGTMMSFVTKWGPRGWKNACGSAKRKKLTTAWISEMCAVMGYEEIVTFKNKYTMLKFNFFIVDQMES